MCTIYGVLLHRTVVKYFFGDLRCFVEYFFVAIYTLLCGEKLSQKMCLWRKWTNIMYAHIMQLWPKKEPAGKVQRKVPHL